MSSSFILKELRKNKANKIVGCDINPSDWLIQSQECHKFYQVPLAINDTYIYTLKDIVIEEKIEYLLPLTDVEVDILNENRNLFVEIGCTICMSEYDTIRLVRNKWELYKYFINDPRVGITSFFSSTEINTQEITDYPYFAKPINGRSSEGVFRIYNKKDLEYILLKDNYLIQSYLEGDIYTVDIVRNDNSNECIVIPRQELLRTSNGAGLTVKLTNNTELSTIAKYVSDKIKINGCVNMEFIYSNGKYYLIDINPRFSAGIAFSGIVVDNIIVNHLNCFSNKEFLYSENSYEELIVVKEFKEVVLKCNG